MQSASLSRSIVESSKLPVFVFPNSLMFYSDDVSSQQQILTIYNPYDFPLKFKVLCTAPKKYRVSDSQGTIKGRCCAEIYIRHKDVCVNNEGIRDKFRVEIFERGQKLAAGKKDVSAVLERTKDSRTPTSLEEKFESLPIVPEQSQDQVYQTSIGRKSRGPSFTAGGPSWIIVLSAVLCIVALMLPTQEEKGSKLPEYLHLSNHQKLIAAYILGLVTMAILRS